MNDVMATPKAAANGAMFHEGFLRAVAADVVLHAQLAAHAGGRHAHGTHMHMHLARAYLPLPSTCLLPLSLRVAASVT